MTGKLGRCVSYLLMGGYLLALSAILVLALHQAMGLVGLHNAYVALPLAGSISHQRWAAISAAGYAKGKDGIAGILLMLVLSYPRRLLFVSLVFVLGVVCVRLYSAQHVVRQVLIRPSPGSLSDRYLLALAADDLVAALRLTDGC